MTFRERWEAYQREQSKHGYTFVPGDEHIFRDAWNAACEACARNQSVMLRDMISRGKAASHCRALRAPLEEITRPVTSSVKEG